MPCASLFCGDAIVGVGVGVTIPFGAQTHCGHQRAHNEDSYLAEPAIGLWIVADGMGGYRHGEIASREAVEQVSRAVRSGEPLIEAVYGAHRYVCEVAAASVDHAQMGTTIVALLLDPVNARYEVAWVGDSRAYLWHPTRGLRQLTRDHSVVQELIDSGVIDAEQARTHPQRNVITRALGGAKMDVKDVESVPGQLLRGEKILLCSDGLYRELSESQITRIVEESTTESKAVDGLIHAALERGGDDNITALLVGAPQTAPVKPPSFSGRTLWQLVRRVALILLMLSLAALASVVLLDRAGQGLVTPPSEAGRP